MKKPPFQTLLDESILSLTVSPELYAIIIVFTPLLSGRGSVKMLLLNFQKGVFTGPHFLEGGYC